MSDLKAKMNQNRFRLGSTPDPVAGAYIAPLGLPAAFKASTSKGRGKEGRERGEERPQTCVGVPLPRMVNPALASTRKKHFWQVSSITLTFEPITLQMSSALCGPVMSNYH